MTNMEQMIMMFNCAEMEGRKLSRDEKNLLCKKIKTLIGLRQNIMEPMNNSKAPLYVCAGKESMDTFCTWNGYRPKTMLFYSNYCELELLRIAYLLNIFGDNKHWIFQNTKQRLKENCFGSFCPVGECFETSIASLRFIATVFPEEKEWIDMYTKSITGELLSGEKKVSYQTVLYFVRTLYEIDNEKTRLYLMLLIPDIRLYEKKIGRGKQEYRGINEQIIKKCTERYFVKAS